MRRTLEPVLWDLKFGRSPQFRYESALKITRSRSPGRYRRERHERLEDSFYSLRSQRGNPIERKASLSVRESRTGIFERSNGSSRLIAKIVANCFWWLPSILSNQFELFEESRSSQKSFVLPELEKRQDEQAKSLNLKLWRLQLEPMRTWKDQTEKLLFVHILRSQKFSVPNLNFSSLLRSALGIFSTCFEAAQSNRRAECWKAN